MDEVFIFVSCLWNNGKPLIKINELSIINHVYLNILKINDICPENIIFLTDNKSIYNEVLGFGGFCYISEEYFENDIYRMTNYIEKEKINKKYVLQISGYEPFFDIIKLENLIKFYIDEHKRNNNVKCGTLFYLNDDYKYVSNKNKIKLVVNRQNYIMYGSRSVIPGIKKNVEAIHNNEKLVSLIQKKRNNDGNRKSDVIKMNDYLSTLTSNYKKYENEHKHNKEKEKENEKEKTNKNIINEKIKYKIHMDVFIFETEYLLQEYIEYNTYYQNMEDIDWLKILEQNYLIYAIQSHLFEVGIDTLKGYNK